MPDLSALGAILHILVFDLTPVLLLSAFLAVWNVGKALEPKADALLERLLAALREDWHWAGVRARAFE